MKKTTISLLVSVLALAGCVSRKQYRMDLNTIGRAFQVQNELNKASFKTIALINDRAERLENKLAGTHHLLTTSMNDYAGIVNVRLEKLEKTKDVVPFGRHTIKPRMVKP